MQQKWSKKYPKAFTEPHDGRAETSVSPEIEHQTLTLQKPDQQNMYHLN
jgi:hypothetical protein